MRRLGQGLIVWIYKLAGSGLTDCVNIIAALMNLVYSCSICKWDSSVRSPQVTAPQFKVFSPVSCLNLAISFAASSTSSADRRNALSLITGLIHKRCWCYY
ncbi:hypothetical protein C8J56DRAFT_922838 [Mycena floridula]|nr:hypothetical protein C8J56DRAFT_922838 [Mycena floridula]